MVNRYVSSGFVSKYCIFCKSYKGLTIKPEGEPYDENMYNVMCLSEICKNEVKEV